MALIWNSHLNETVNEKTGAIEEVAWLNGYVTVIGDNLENTLDG